MAFAQAEISPGASRTSSAPSPTHTDGRQYPASFDNAIIRATNIAIAMLERMGATPTQDDAGLVAGLVAGNTAEETAWLKYLAALTASTPAARIAERLWGETRRKILAMTGRRLGVPVTIRGDDASLHLAWDVGHHHVDVDVLSDGSLEWFYRDRSSEILDGTEDACGASPAPVALVTRLALVAR